VSIPSGFEGSGRSPGRRIRAGSPVVAVVDAVPPRVVDDARVDDVDDFVLVHAPNATAVPSSAAPRRKSRRSNRSI
jgi:hypothetical protein